MNTTVLATIPSSRTNNPDDYAYLDLLARVKKALASAREIAVPADQIRAYPDQPRDYFDEAHIEGLAKSIDAGGQTTRGMIREKRGETPYELIDGECRWRGILRIPESRRPLYKADLIDADDEVVQYLIAGVANFNRRGHTAIEVTRTIERLVGFKLPMEEIAGLLGISKFWAEQMYGLRKLSSEVQKMLNPALPKERQLPVTAAIQISKIEPKYQSGLAERVIAKDITLGRLRGEVVRVAQKEGSQIRVRDVSPHHLWASFGNKIDVIGRTAADAEELIAKHEVKRFAKVNTNAEHVNNLLRRIQDAKESLSQIEAQLRVTRAR